MHNNLDAIHETVIRDIVDLVQNVKDDEALPGIFNRRSLKSITKASDALTLVFPVLTTNSISIENASMISKAIERKAVGMLQMLFSAINITDATDAFDYVGKFHKNLKMNSVGIDQFIDDIDNYVARQEAAGFNVVVDKDKYDAVKKDIKNLSFYLPSSISEQSLNSFKISKITFW